MTIDRIMEQIELVLKRDDQVTLEDATTGQLHEALGRVVMDAIADDWYESRHAHERARCAYYFSAEYLTGRMVYNNLFALGILEQVRQAFADRGLDLAMFEDIDDAALGNGGLGRLAACFLDSAATMDLPLDGYGLRYKYGLFKQTFQDGFQNEAADDWQRLGDPWSRRRDTHEVTVTFADQTVRAIPYDMPVIGYGTRNIGTLRLWESAPLTEFDFKLFNDQEYALAVQEKNSVEDITRVLYPNDSTPAGKKLRLKQQYFLSSASLQDILFRYKREARPIEQFAKYVTIQLNDTHPVVSVPELVRLLMREGLGFEQAFSIAAETFNFTNHTIMAEALEKWDVELFKSVLPEIFDIIYRINARLCGELMARGMDCSHMAIIQGHLIHMANLAVYSARFVNGVAAIHTEILKTSVFRDWYRLFPERFHNKTNGITQRRWLGLCNPELLRFIEERVGAGCMHDLDRLALLKEHLSDDDVRAFNAVKQEKKRQLSEVIGRLEGVPLPPEFVFDVQVKRLHEYKRQLLNAFAILDIYFGIKDGRVQDFAPTAFLFGAKAAPGYIRAKAIIKYINEVARLVNGDPAVNELMRVVFVQNYNCSYAEHIMPAANISEQISPAGTEASGTGNMKLMLNGAVTLGTYDGANIEIVQQAGEDNNYIFGYRVEELNARRDSYDPRAIYEREPRVRRVVDTLIDGTYRTTTRVRLPTCTARCWRATGRTAISSCWSSSPIWSARCRPLATRAIRSPLAASALSTWPRRGKFSSDRTIGQYARETWFIEPVPQPGR